MIIIVELILTDHVTLTGVLIAINGTVRLSFKKSIYNVLF